MSESTTKTNLNTTPEILKNMPHGINVLFGAGDNSVKKFTKQLDNKHNKNVQNRINVQKAQKVKTTKSNNSDATNLFDPDNFIQNGANQNMEIDPVAVEFAAFGPNSYNQNNPKQGQTAFNADYYYAFNDQTRSLSKNTVYVGGIPPQYTKEDLKEVFKPFGKIISAFISKAGAVAFVEFDKSESTEKAIKAQNNNIPPNGKWPWVVKRANYNR